MVLCPFFMLAQEAKETQDTATVHLKGRVVDEDQSPVEFATVRVEGQPIGTTTDLNGQYRLSFKTADSVAILYNMIGYEKRRRVLKKPQGNLTLNIVMRSAGKDMTEVTVSDTRRQMGTTQAADQDGLGARIHLFRMLVQIRELDQFPGSNQDFVHVVILCGLDFIIVPPLSFLSKILFPPLSWSPGAAGRTISG